MALILRFALVLFLSGCAAVQTRLGRFDGAGPQEASLDFRRERAIEEYRQARNELGLSNVELSDRHKELIGQRVELNRLERDIRTETEKSQYYMFKPYLRGDHRRIAFLKIPTVEQREAWLARTGLAQKISQNSPFESSAVLQNDIFIGMSKSAVKESWGDPESVEVAGNPTYGNERWKYSTYITTADGFSEETRMIYFEGGRVVGWNKN